MALHQSVYLTDEGVENLRQELQSEKISLPQDAAVSIEKTGTKWQITHRDKITHEDKSYTIEKERNRLNVYGRRARKGDLLDRGNSLATMVLLVGMLGQ